MNLCSDCFLYRASFVSSLTDLGREGKFSTAINWKTLTAANTENQGISITIIPVISTIIFWRIC